MHEVKLYKSRWKAIKLLLLASLFVIFSLYDIINHAAIMPTLLSWGGLCFFGLGIYVNLFNFFDKRPEVILNEQGIFSRSSYSVFDKRPKRGFVEWINIKDVYIREFKNNWRGLPTSSQVFICINLLYEDEKYNKTNLFSRNLGVGDVSIPLINLSVNKQDFLEFIKAMVSADEQTKATLIINTNL